MKKLLLTTLGVALSVTQTYGMANLKSMVSDVIAKEDLDISNLPQLLQKSSEIKKKQLFQAWDSIIKESPNDYPSKDHRAYPEIIEELALDLQQVNYNEKIDSIKNLQNWIQTNKAEVKLSEWLPHWAKTKTDVYVDVYNSAPIIGGMITYVDKLSENKLNLFTKNPDKIESIYLRGIVQDVEPAFFESFKNLKKVDASQSQITDGRKNQLETKLKKKGITFIK